MQPRLERTNSKWKSFCDNGRKYMLSDANCNGHFGDEKIRTAKIGNKHIAYNKTYCRIDRKTYLIDRVSSDFMLFQLPIIYHPKSGVKCRCHKCASGNNIAHYKVGNKMYCKYAVHINTEYFNLSTYEYWLWSHVTRDYGRDAFYHIFVCYARWKAY